MEHTHTLIVGGGQAGLAASAHLTANAIPHLIVERGSIAERWRSARWDSLTMNGPAWHDRFPPMDFSGWAADSFPTKDAVVDYFEAFAASIKAPVRCGVEVYSAVPSDQAGYAVETSKGVIHANNIIAATGPFQVPTRPDIVPDAAVRQLHSFDYKNPRQIEDGAVLVVGSGSSGAQIADELMQAGRQVYLSIGPHERPPRSYRGKDYCWWLGTLGKWQAKVPPAGREHVTIAVSGADGGKTVDFREFAHRGMTLLGMTQNFKDGLFYFAGDLGENIADGDKNYLALLAEADHYITQNKLSFPREDSAKIIPPDPPCLKTPIRQLDLQASGIKTLIWATGYKQNFDWLAVDCFTPEGQPDHQRGVSSVNGIYFLGLPWLSMRGSSFIWGVWDDAAHIAGHIANPAA